MFNGRNSIDCVPENNHSEPERASRTMLRSRLIRKEFARMHTLHSRPPRGLGRRALAIGAAALTTSLLIAGCSSTPSTEPSNGGDDAAAETFDIRLSHTLPEANPVHTVAVEVADAIRERTDGTVNIDVYGAGTIGSTAETTEQASLGQPMISYVDASHVAEYGVSEFGMLTSPFLLADYEEADNILESDLFAEWTEELADVGDLQVLALNWFAGPRHIVGNKAVPEPDDLTGVKIRIPEARTWEIIFGELLPSTPVAIPSSEQFAALQQGVVDAGEIPLKSIVDLGFNEVATDITLTGHLNLFLGFVMPASIFQEMSAEQQEIVLEEFRKGGIAATEQTTAGDAEARELMESQGIAFHEADIPAYRDATVGYFDFFDWDSETVDRLLAARDGE
ncbi:TRAP transporter substrate-binding protein DctP [Microbacterium sp. Mu-80]|uniref:TRAP transporter substrate-binding protein DctP n=1 Tax=Microbacterium bandirmense TaxID=3122050 RepID=A0ABU8LF62_9MICO